jgi:hypothetical protein
MYTPPVNSGGFSVYNQNNRGIRIQEGARASQLRGPDTAPPDNTRGKSVEIFDQALASSKKKKKADGASVSGPKNFVSPSYAPDIYIPTSSKVTPPEIQRMERFGRTKSFQNLQQVVLNTGAGPTDKFIQRIEEFKKRAFLKNDPVFQAKMDILISELKTNFDNLTELRNTKNLFETWLNPSLNRRQIARTFQEAVDNSTPCLDDSKLETIKYIHGSLSEWTRGESTKGSQLDRKLQIEGAKQEIAKLQLKQATTKAIVAELTNSANQYHACESVHSFDIAIGRALNKFKSEDQMHKMINGIWPYIGAAAGFVPATIVTANCASNPTAVMMSTFLGSGGGQFIFQCVGDAIKHLDERLAYGGSHL